MDRFAYLQEWAELAKSFDIATGYFEIGSLIDLDGRWQQLDEIRILMGDETSKRTHQALLEAVKSRAQIILDDSIENNKEQNPFLKGNSPLTTYTGPNNPMVARVGWSDETVWLNSVATKKGQPAIPGTIGFRGVPEAVWEFHIGGYQVCHKWLKDRKGRILLNDDITYYQKIVVALNETIRIMKEIDDVIEKHGGWPDAFKEG
jgi:hypothetical protein